MCLPYALYFYLSEHEFTYRNTRVIKHILNMCLPHGEHASTSHLAHVEHASTSHLAHVEHAVCACLLYSRLLFKPVVSGCISLASH
jgi:hypothetical protein